MSALQQNFRKTEKIAIAGRPMVGKTTLAQKLSQKTGLPIVSTDDYIDKVSFEDAPVKIIEDLEKRQGGYIVEGVQVARMLRKGLKLGIWQPDTVILVENRGSSVRPQHGGIAGMNRQAFKDWMDEKGAVRVIYENNSFSLSREDIHDRAAGRRIKREQGRAPDDPGL